MNSPNFSNLSICFFLSTLFFFGSCYKEKFVTNASEQPILSIDTIEFDTVFTTLGSTTRELRIRNPHNKTLRISSLQLSSGATSSFSINVDGAAGSSFSNIDIPANDSIYVFAKVTIDPNSSNTPFVVADQLLILSNGTTQTVALQAFGQNAYYHRRQTVRSDTTWTADKPHVIVDWVFVDSAQTLSIDAGARICTFGNYDDPYQLKGKLLVLGQLLINGNKDSIVRMQGARLEPYWQDKAGQWNGIQLFANSGQSIIKYTEIKGATTGIKIDSLPNVAANYNLIIEQSTIKHISGSAILGFTSKVQATNLLAYDCNGAALGFINGGTIALNHCTLSSCTDAGLLVATNFLKQGNTIVSTTPMNISIKNCIIWDKYTETIGFGINENATFVSVLNTNLLKSTNTDITADCIDCLMNEDPQFKDFDAVDFTLTMASPCIDMATGTSVSIDLDGNLRGALADIGCYEE